MFLHSLGRQLTFNTAQSTGLLPLEQLDGFVRRSKLDFVYLSRIADGFRQAVEQDARYFHHIALIARPAVNPFTP